MVDGLRWPVGIAGTYDVAVAVVFLAFGAQSDNGLFVVFSVLRERTSVGSSKKLDVAGCVGRSSVRAGAYCSSTWRLRSTDLLAARSDGLCSSYSMSSGLTTTLIVSDRSNSLSSFGGEFGLRWARLPNRWTSCLVCA